MTDECREAFEKWFQRHRNPDSTKANYAWAAFQAAWNARRSPDARNDALEEAAPVAWRYVPSEVWKDWVLTMDAKHAQQARECGCNVEPLYLAPSPARWRRCVSRGMHCRPNYLLRGRNGCATSHR